MTSQRNVKSPKNNHLTPIKSALLKEASEKSVPRSQKRYLVVVSHEVIIYAENEKVAEGNLRRSESMKDRTNLKIVYMKEIPLPENEPIQLIDTRKAPGQ